MKKPIQVVERAFDILEYLTGADKAMRSSDLAEKFGISVQSANNLLRTLYNRGYIAQDANRAYMLGPQCFVLGSHADRWEHMRTVFCEPLQMLTRDSGFDGFAGVIECDKLFCVVLTRTGDRCLHQPPQIWGGELHSTACGRILLAALDDEERSRLFARTTRRKMTGKTVVDPVELTRLCETIREAGFAEVHDESREGISSLAIPVRDCSGKTFAGLALSGRNEAWNIVPLQEKLTLLRRYRAMVERF